MWAAYANIDTIVNSAYLHLSINHSLHFVDHCDRLINSQNVENMRMMANRKQQRQLVDIRGIVSRSSVTEEVPATGRKWRWRSQWKCQLQVETGGQ